MTRLVLVLVLLASCFNSVIAQPVGEGNGGIVRAKNGDGLAVQVPKGWILDNRAMAKQGIDMLFYPADNSFKGLGPDTPVFAYVMPTYKGTSNVSVSGLIEMRDKQIRQSDRAAATVIEQPAKFDENKVSTVTIVRYAIPSFPRFEKVAYLEDERTIYSVILSASTSDELEKQSPFIDFVINNHKRMVSEQSEIARSNDTERSKVTFSGVSKSTEFDMRFRQYVIDWMSKEVERKTNCKLRAITASSPVYNEQWFGPKPADVPKRSVEIWKVEYCEQSAEMLVRFDITDQGVKFGAEQMNASVKSRTPNSAGNDTVSR